jgi:hypothetical protein
MENVLVAILSAVLGGTFVLIGQWYIFRKERYANRRNVLYYLLEIYGNVKRLDRIKGVNVLYERLFNKLGIELNESTISIREKFALLIYENLFTDVLDELDDLDEYYPDVVEDLAKENPTLAVSISHYSRMLGKIVVYVNEMTGKLKEDANEDDHSRIEYVMSSLMHNGLITDSAYELKVDILRISQSISVFEKQRVKKMLERMEKFEITEEEINKVILPMIQMVKSQNL